MIKKIATVVVTVLLLVVFTGLLQEIVKPKYVSEQKEGSLIEEYYSQEKNFDVLFVGDCEVYENFIPQVLWDTYGIHSYIRGSAQQLIWQSYYLLEEMLAYETPEVVVFSILSMQYNEPQREEYNRINLDGMKWSLSKIKAVNASMLEKESFLDYVFPILRFHDRYSSLSWEDVTQLFGKDTVSHNGYLMQVGIRGIDLVNAPQGKVLADYQFGDQAYLYLDKMVALCKEHDVELVLVKPPSIYPYWYPQWDEQIKEYAQEAGIGYYNFLDDIDEIGLDFQVDTYDMGAHLNLTGATKMSLYFGEILQRDYAISDRREEEELQRIWDEKKVAFELERDRLYLEEEMKNEED